MMTFLLVVHILLALALIGVILVQRSEGGALGMGGGGGGGGFMTARGSANLLTRTTAVLATLFIVSSIVLAILSGGPSQPRSILDSAPATTPAAPAEPAKPAVPLSQ
ncbi:MAG: preprotein translocase subunit SecG [Ferrovibrio sp.]|uniref:preprotein translocase subunit SecG n=1 Tax=Ferrovibrio sp. TaxID=1917215 RepID=UPI00263451A5|nr:preprotein translocase subunit SecG [Ferrovibrio sp.]MCW0231995.1 preprotein translocase subunit SecG [Ferrovibrio sp.]